MERTCSSMETLRTFQRKSTIDKRNAIATPIPNAIKIPPTFVIRRSAPEALPSSYNAIIVMYVS